MYYFERLEAAPLYFELFVFLCNVICVSASFSSISKREFNIFDIFLCLFKKSMIGIFVLFAIHALFFVVRNRCM